MQLLEGVALDVEGRHDAVEPLREPPVLRTEQFHRGGHEQHANQRGVEQYGQRQTRAEQFDDPVVLQQEGAEHDHHDRRRGGDHPGGRRQSVGDRVHRIAGAVVLLLDARQQEHLVVHRQAEHDREQHHRHERFDRRRLDAGQSAEPAPLEDGDDDAVGGRDRQHVHDDRLERHQQRAEHHHQQQERHGEYGAEEDQDAATEIVTEVDVGRHRSGQVGGDAGALDERRDHVGAQPGDGVFGDGVLGGRGGDDPQDERLGGGRVGPVAGERERHRIDAGVLGDHGTERLDRFQVVGSVDLHGENERAVVARSETVGDQVVGLAGGGGLGEVALVGETEPQCEHRQCQQYQQSTGDGDAAPGPGLHDAAPAVGPRFADRLVLARRHLAAERLDGQAGEQGDDHEHTADRAQGGDPEPEPEQGDGGEPGGDQTAPAGDFDSFVGERQQRREQGDRGEQGEEHRGCRGDAEPGHELQPDQQHAEQREHDGDAGEHDCPAGRVHRPDRGLLGCGPGPGQLAVSGDDEQGIVDPDSEPDHDADQRGELGDREQVGQQGDQAEPTGADAGDGDTDRQTHRQHRPECQDQHHDGERQADQLRLRRLELGEHRSTDLGSQAIDPRQQFFDRDADRRSFGLADVVGEVDLGEGDRAVVADLLGPERRVRADDVDARDLTDRLEHDRHRFGDLGRGDPVGRLEHDLAAEHTAGPREVFGEGVESAGALGGRGLELTVVRRTDDAADRVEADDQSDPDPDDDPSVVVAPTCECAVHQNLRVGDRATGDRAGPARREG